MYFLLSSDMDLVHAAPDQRTSARVSFFSLACVPPARVDNGLTLQSKVEKIVFPTPEVNQELVWACGRFLKLWQAADQIEQSVALVSDLIRRSEQSNDFNSAVLTGTKASAELDHEPMLAPHPSVHVIVPRAPFKVSLNRAQMPELGRDIFDRSLTRSDVLCWFDDVIAGFAGMPSTRDQEKQYEDHRYMAQHKMNYREYWTIVKHSPPTHQVYPIRICIIDKLT
jgi:hypothetical protein